MHSSNISIPFCGCAYNNHTYYLIIVIILDTLLKLYNYSERTKAIILLITTIVHNYVCVFVKVSTHGLYHNHQEYSDNNIQHNYYCHKSGES